MTQNFDKNVWTAEAASQLIGKKVLIAIMHERPDGVVVRKDHMHGRVQQATPTAGIAVALEGKRAGETYWLPPELRAFTPSAPGMTYTLDTTGEVIESPDYLSTWTFNTKS